MYLPRTLNVLHRNVFPVYGTGSTLHAGIGDANIHRFLDFTSGIGVLATGYSHPKIVNAVKQQSELYTHSPQILFNTHNAIKSFTNKFKNIMPSPMFNTIFYTNSGSEANDNALKIAKCHTGRQNIIAINRGFHGRTYGSLSVSSSNLNCKKHTASLLPGVFFCEPTIESFKNVLTFQSDPDDTACVIYESVQGEGGVFSLDAPFLHEMSRICDEHDILTIADEVQCGVGRTGTYWNIEQKNVIPDIMTFAKGIAGGYPLGGLVCNNKHTDQLPIGMLGGTFGGNPISCAAAKATLDIFKEEDILVNVNGQSAFLERELNKLPHVKEVRCYGLMIGIELDFDENSGTARKIVEKLNEKKVLVLLCGNKSQYIRLLPPLNVKTEECEEFLDIFKSILKTF